MILFNKGKENLFSFQEVLQHSCALLLWKNTNVLSQIHSKTVKEDVVHLRGSEEGKVGGEEKRVEIM